MTAAAAAVKAGSWEKLLALLLGVFDLAFVGR